MLRTQPADRRMPGMPTSELTVAQAVHDALRAAGEEDENGRWELDLRLRPQLIAGRESWIEDAPDDDLPEDLQAALDRYATTERS